MAYYRGLQDLIGELERQALLVRVKQPICKDTQLMPLVRWQFRGLPEEQRRAFLFEHVVDLTGRRYDMPVLVGGAAASTRVLAVGLQMEPGEIGERWTQALQNPLPPREVAQAPVHEVVLAQDQLDRPGGGLEALPVPISTPGFDNAPYFTAACWVTKDPETGQYNVGNYRGQVKSRTRVGIYTYPTQHLAIHWQKCRERGVPLEAALVVGATTNLTCASIMKMPYTTDEYSVAGAVVGEPVELVRCKTLDLLVPANAEMVIEGQITTQFLEPEGPFGEYTGYMGSRTLSPYMEVRCITHRRDPIMQVLLSEKTPSEASTMSHKMREYMYYKFLRFDCNNPAILEVAFHAASGPRQFIVIRMKPTHPSQAWQALHAASSFDPATGKIIIVVDEDIDAHDTDAVNWAICFRVQPHRDTRVVTGKVSALDHSVAPPAEHPFGISYPFPEGASSLLVNATRDWTYPPVSLPRREYMEAAKALWEELGLPRLQPKTPWYGYELGYWPQELAEEADRAMRGEYLANGAAAEQRRVHVEEAMKPR
jgi:UbiD family decarboxylase